MTYHREDRRGGRTYYRVAGRRASEAEAQREVVAALRGWLESMGIVGYTGEIDRPPAWVECPACEQFEANDADQSLEDVQAAYELAGAEGRGFGNDEDDVVEPDVDWSWRSLELLDRYWREWELGLRESSFGRWAMRDRRIGVAISYYAVAHKIVYEGAARFGALVRTPYAPLGREAYGVLRERMRRVEDRSEQPVQWRLVGFFTLFKFLT